MVDEDKIKDNALAREGLKMLAQSGVLREIIADSEANLISGDSDEEERSLVRRIREHRRFVGVVLTLQELGESFLEENSDEPR